MFSFARIFFSCSLELGTGNYSVCYSAGALCTQFWLLPIVVKHFSNFGATRAALYTQTLFVLVIALGGTPGFEFLAHPATAYMLGAWRGTGTMYFPSINAAVTNCADKSEQATVMGAVHGIQSLANAVCLLLFGVVCKYTSSHSWTNQAPAWINQAPESCVERLLVITDDWNQTAPFYGAACFYGVCILFTYKLQKIVTADGCKKAEGGWEHGWNYLEVRPKATLPQNILGCLVHPSHLLGSLLGPFLC